jgi:hypothetical protein
MRFIFRFLAPPVQRLIPIFTRFGGYLLIVSLIGGSLFIILVILIWIFDLIFYTSVGPYIQTQLETFYGYIQKQLETFYDQTILPLFLPLWHVVYTRLNAIWQFVDYWLNISGIIEFVSNVSIESLRFTILLIVFVILGFSFYHLRVARKFVYASIELGVSVIAMLFAINGMAGGHFTMAYIIAMLSGLYIMIRGLQNTDDALRELAESETRTDNVNGYGKPSYELWKAVFYDVYKKSSFSERDKRIRQAISEMKLVRKAKKMMKTKEAETFAPPETAPVLARQDKAPAREQK